LKPDATPFDLIQALFPGGTITGVPKIRCMEIIEELEPVRRGLYTGSFGYISWNGDLDLNIVIRTLVWCGGKGYLQVGAGIVADSDPAKEYEETLQKAQAFFSALQQTKPALLMSASAAIPDPLRLCVNSERDRQDVRDRRD
jgi:anthranilate/para-aminobenzoate synthase component I